METTGRLFTGLPTAARQLAGTDAELGPEVPPGAAQQQQQQQQHRARELQLSGTAEVCSPADRASVRLSVGYSKESVSEVTDSVSRRLGYILQTLRQHGVKDEDTTVRRFLHREPEIYRMDAEVTVIFSNFEKMEEIRSILLEKLDRSVCVGPPQFYHSDECLSELRQRACVSAVENAKQKASKVGQVVGQSLGPPLLVREEETQESRNDDGGDAGGERGAPRLPRVPTVTASSRVFVSFSLKPRKQERTVTREVKGSHLKTQHRI